MHNKIFGAILILLALYLIVHTCRNSNAADEDKKDQYYNIIQNGIIKIGVQKESPPFNDVENGKPVGFDYEIAQLIFSRNEFGLTSENSIDRSYFSPTYDGIPKLLFNKNSDIYTVDIVMGGLTFDDDDLDGVIYSIPYIDGFGYSLVAEEELNISSIGDLRSMKVGCVEGDQDVLEYISQIIPRSCEIVELSDEESTWMSNAIEDNKADVIIYDFPFAAVELENMERTNLEIKIAKLPGSEISYKIGIRDNNPKLLEELNSAIRKVKELREYDSLIRKYLPTRKVKKVEITSSDKVYVVKSGESLSAIADKCLGNGSRYEEIAYLNNIGQPNLIFSGQKLKLPSDSNCR